MPDRNPGNVPSRDLPWNDVPADSDVIPGSEEPDPAEVEGDEDEEVDVSRRPSPDIAAQYHRDTLDERLAQEVPDRAVRATDREAGEIMAAEYDGDGEDDVTLDLGETDDEDENEDDEAAEDAAVHVHER